ncbi:MAG TPA: hypothetical protein VJ925_11200 [Longimicrobiales bacterium]|nr:hypothetical protein [Longimicrobiales bacterium]
MNEDPNFRRPVAPISPHLPHSVVAAEDAGLCRQDGFDRAEGGDTTWS